jgi:hypothetical protein
MSIFSSQPLIGTDVLADDSGVHASYSQPITEQDMSHQERESRIQQLLNDYPEIRTIIQNFEIDGIEIDGSRVDKAFANPKFLLFIGRLNPLHEGHIATIFQMISYAIRSIPPKHVLILLGSGPQQTGIDDKRTLDNPISFDLKSRILMEKLLQTFTSEDLEQFVSIQEMTNLSTDVKSFIEQHVKDSTLDIQDIEVTHFAGGKDDDAGKFAFVFGNVEKGTEESFGVPVWIESIAVDAEAAGGSVLSATSVRKRIYWGLKDALSRRITNSAHLVREIMPKFSKFTDFYGDNTEPLVQEVIFPVTRVLESNPDMSSDIQRILGEYIVASHEGGRKEAATKLNRIYKAERHAIEAREAIEARKAIEAREAKKKEGKGRFNESPTWSKSQKPTRGGSNKSKRKTRRRRIARKTRRSHSKRVL